MNTKKRVWIVRAGDIDDSMTYFDAVFTDRETADKVARYGQQMVPELHWLFIDVLFDDMPMAIEDIQALAEYFNKVEE